MIPTSKIANLVIIMAGSITFLVIGKSLLIPFVLAILIWFLITELRQNLLRIPIVGKKFPKWVWTALATVLLFVICSVGVGLLVENITAFSQNIPQYTSNFSKLNTTLNESFNIDLSEYWNDFLNNNDLVDMVTSLLSSVTGLFGNAFMIILYVMFLFTEETVFKGKLISIFKNSNQLKEVNTALNEIGYSIGHYISLKTIISLVTGVASYVALYFIGIDTPIFWAFLIFLLNYIPTVGSLIGTLFPAIIALFQFGEFLPFLLVIGIVGAIQLIVGNVIEPKVMGQSLNLSSLTIILALSFWTAIWGITGAILSVPITVIILIVFKHFKSTIAIAKLLSEKGKV